MSSTTLTTNVVYTADRTVNGIIKEGIASGAWTAEVRGGQVKFVHRKSQKILWVNRTQANATYIRKLQHDMQRITDPVIKPQAPKKRPTVVKSYDPKLTSRTDQAPFKLLHPHDSPDYIAPEDFNIMLDLLSKQRPISGELVVRENRHDPRYFDVGYFEDRINDQKQVEHTFQVAAYKLPYADAMLWKQLRIGMLAALMKYIVCLQTQHEETIRLAKIWAKEAEPDTVGTRRLAGLSQKLEHWLSPVKAIERAQAAE